MFACDVSAALFEGFRYIEVPSTFPIVSLEAYRGKRRPNK